VAAGDPGGGPGRGSLLRTQSWPEDHYSNPQRFVAFESPSGEEALSELLRRFLHSYGPATPQQFAKWLSTPPRFITELFAATPGLEQVKVNGDAAWVVAGDTEFSDEPVRGVRLLPYFDAYAVGSHPRELLFPGAASTRALAGGQAGNFPVLLVDGIVAGVWHQKRSGRRLHVTVEPLHDLTAASLRALDDQVARLGEILDATPALTVGTVTVGAHA
jgi:hypothetical protein